MLHRNMNSKQIQSDLTSLYSAPYLGSQHDATRSRVSGVCNYRSIAGTRRLLLLNDICCTRPSAAANQSHVAAAVDRRDRQMDGRTDTRPLHRPYTSY